MSRFSVLLSRYLWRNLNQQKRFAMLYSIKIIISILALFFAFNSKAQETDVLKNYPISGFTELQSSLNTEVIIIKSSRNNVLIQGSKKAQNEIIILEEEGRLAIFSKEEEPTRVVIETTGIGSLISGGTGNYFVIGLDQERFVLFNPSAKVTVSGNLDNLYLTSEDGQTDLSNVYSIKEWITISDQASYIESKRSGKDLIAKKSLK